MQLVKKTKEKTKRRKYEHIFFMKLLQNLSPTMIQLFA